MTFANLANQLLLQSPVLARLTHEEFCDYCAAPSADTL